MKIKKDKFFPMFVEKNKKEIGYLVSGYISDGVSVDDFLENLTEDEKKEIEVEYKIRLENEDKRQAELLDLEK